MESADVNVVHSEDAFTLDVQIYVNNETPDRVQTVTLCNVLAFVCRCPVCDKCFSTAPTLKMHMKCHADIETQTQSVTEVVAEDKGEKTGDDNYTCVASVQSGEQHFIFITQSPTEDGDKKQSAVNQIKRRSSPREASKEVMARRPFQCNKCDLAFMTRTKLSIHFRTHTGEKPFTCEVCQKAFATRGEVTVHGRVHTGEKPYTCVECGTCHRTRSALHGHIHRYHQKRAYKCDTCNKTFAIKSYFQAHLRVHDEKNPFRCNICEKVFPYQSFLDKHMNTHSSVDGASPDKKKRGKKRGKKPKQTKAKSSKIDESTSISTEEKEKIAVEFLQKGRAAGDASQETEQTETLTNISQTSNARVISSNIHSKETVLQIETIKNGTPEMIYVTLADSDIQQVAGDGTQLTLVQEPADSSQLEAILPTAQLTSQNVQFVSDQDVGMVVVTEASEDTEQVVVSDAPIVTEESQVAAILSQNEETTSDPTEYARRVDAVVQELEKRINTNE